MLSEMPVVSDNGMSGWISEAASQFTQTSIGMEIVEEDDNSILIRDLMDHSNMHPRKGLERMRNLVRLMVKDALKFDGDVSTISNMDNRDTEVDRIHWLNAVREGSS